MERVFFILLLLLPIKGYSESFPITLLKGYILTEATIEDQTVLVIFDTGAPGLVLNEKYYKADPSSTIPCTGINGSFEAITHQVKQWSWLGVSHKRTNALVSDLTFLEKSLNRKVHALIGLEVLNDYYVTIDYDFKTIDIDKDPDEKMNGQFSKFQYIGHLPVMACKVNGAKKILGIDTGSAGNYFFDYDQASDENLVASASPILVIGTDNKEDIKYQMPMQLEVPDCDIHLTSTFIVDLQDEGYFQHAGFDGLLGQDFLQQYKIVIHPGKQKICLMKRAEQMSFVSSLMP
ncbi:MAG TPA: aspartyl protease family protein [Saprospiraceae bacterium]|nr:aspartyl protease family protein [Saprospiraceae bacterium]